MQKNVLTVTPVESGVNYHSINQSILQLHKLDPSGPHKEWIFHLKEANCCMFECFFDAKYQSTAVSVYLGSE